MTLEKSVFAIVLILVIAFATITWEESRGDRARLEKAIATQQQIIDSAELREQSRDANLKITLSQIETTQNAAKTPQQILDALQQSLELPQLITLGAGQAVKQPDAKKGSRASAIAQVRVNSRGTVTPDHNRNPGDLPISQISDPKGNDCYEPSSSRSQEDISALPSEKAEIENFLTRKSQLLGNTASRPNEDSAPVETVTPKSGTDGVTSIPTSHLKPLFDKIESCEACEAQLAAVQADLADEKIRSESFVKERNEVLVAAKGGNFWHRVRQNAKWLAIGAIIATTALRIR